MIKKEWEANFGSQITPSQLKKKNIKSVIQISYCKTKKRF